MYSNILVRRGSCNITYTSSILGLLKLHWMTRKLRIDTSCIILIILDPRACHAAYVGIFDVGCVTFIFFWESIVTFWDRQRCPLPGGLVAHVHGRLQAPFLFCKSLTETRCATNA